MRSIFLWALVLAANPLAQADPVNKPLLNAEAESGAGYVIYKEHDFYNDTFSEVSRFIGLTELPKGINDGKVRFVLEDQKMIYMPARWITAIFYDSEIIPDGLNNDEQLQSYKGLRQRIVEAATLNSTANSTLTPLLAKIDENIRWYESGNRKINGEWLTPEMMTARRVGNDEARIRQECSEIQVRIQSCSDLNTCQQLRGDIATEGNKKFPDAASQSFLADTLRGLTQELDAVQSAIEGKLHSRANTAAEKAVPASAFSYWLPLLVPFLLVFGLGLIVLGVRACFRGERGDMPLLEERILPSKAPVESLGANVIHPEAKRVYISINGETKGPYTNYQIYSMWQMGNFQKGTLCFNDSSQQWEELDGVIDKFKPSKLNLPK